MHPAVNRFIAEHAARLTAPYSVLEVGSLDVNGSIRHSFPGSSLYVGLDIHPGPGVDIVADASTWLPDRSYDIVVTTEVMEHTPVWRDILSTCYSALTPGGLFLATFATTGRGPHNAHGAATIKADEYYANVGVADFSDWVATVGWAECEIRVTIGCDIHFRGIKSGLPSQPLPLLWPYP